MSSGAKAQTVSTKLSPVGVALVIFGAAITVLAAWRYNVVNREIEAGLVKTDRALVWFVTIAIAVASVALIVYMMMMSGTE